MLGLFGDGCHKMRRAITIAEGIDREFPLSSTLDHDTRGHTLRPTFIRGLKLTLGHTLIIVYFRRLQQLISGNEPIQNSRGVSHRRVQNARGKDLGESLGEMSNPAPTKDNAAILYGCPAKFIAVFPHVRNISLRWCLYAVTFLC